MPSYVNSPFQTPPLVQKGVSTYLIGSYSQQVGNTNLAVATVALTTNVATITAILLNGPLPTANTLISINNSTSTSGLFNVTRVAVTSVSYDAPTNTATIVFPLTHANVVSAADVGNVILEPAEVGESVTSAGYTSIACCVQAPEGDSQFTVPFAFNAAAGVTAATATLQVALKNIDSEFTNTTTTIVKTGASTYTAGQVAQATLQRGYFYRVAVTGVTGSGLAVSKIGG